MRELLQEDSGYEGEEEDRAVMTAAVHELPLEAHLHALRWLTEDNFDTADVDASKSGCWALEVLAHYVDNEEVVVAALKYLCVVGDNTDYCTPDSSWSVRGVLEAISRYRGNAALMHDALRILCHVARGPDVRLVEGEDMTIAIPALTAAFRGTLERLDRSETRVGDDGALALVLLGDAAKFGGAPTAQAFLQAGTAGMAVDLLKGVHDTVLEEVEEAYECAAWILAAACEHTGEHTGDDAAPLKALLEAGAVDAVAHASMSSQLREGFYGPPLLVKIIAALSAVASPRELSQLATQAPFVERQMFRSQFIVRGVVDAGLRFLVKLVELTDYDPSTALRMVQENGHAHAVQALQDAQIVRARWSAERAAWVQAVVLAAQTRPAEGDRDYRASDGSHSRARRA